ncbi:MAG: hypothetical protein ACXVAY_00240 [Mucilaginibacter sp.]
MQLENYKLRILDLVQRWRVDLLNEAERNELETLFRSLDDCSLGVPNEMSIDQLEKRLHQLFGNPFKEPDDNEGPPNPFK